MMKTLILLLSFIAGCLSVRTPTISWITKEQVLDIGRDTSLECSVQYASEYPVLWLKEGIDGGQDLPISSGPQLILREARYSLRYDSGSSTYILQIKDVQETDGGRYLCQVLIGLNNRISASVDLVVRQSPFISDNSTRSVVVGENEPVTLQCWAGGIPVPSISWRRENNAILPTGGSIYKGNTLRIPAIRKEDRGTYYCIADNGVGRGARRNINVEVEFKPVVKSIQPRVFQALQYDADLQCNVESYPPAAISWIFRREQINNDQHYRISQFATADEFTDTTLLVKSVEKRQFGTYTCLAANKLGQANATVILEESITPICPPACEPQTFASSERVACSLSLHLLAPLLLLVAYKKI